MNSFPSHPESDSNAGAGDGSDAGSGPESHAGAGSDDASARGDESLFVMTLDQLLKYHAVVGSGGEAKYLIQSGVVSVNGAVETRRRRKLHRGDVVELEDVRIEV